MQNQAQPAPDEPQPIYVRDEAHHEAPVVPTDQAAPAQDWSANVTDRLADTGGPALVASLVGMGVAGAGMTLVGNGVAERRHRRKLEN